MRTTHSQSHPLQFSVVSRTLPDDEPTVAGICEQDNPDDGFLVTLTLSDGDQHAVRLTEPELRTLGRTIEQRFGDEDPLLGHFFHVLQNDKVEKQGRVTGIVQPGYYLVTFFGCLNGEKNGSEIAKFTDMIDQDWVFYDDEEQWRAAGDEHLTRQHLDVRQHQALSRPRTSPQLRSTGLTLNAGAATFDSPKIRGLRR